MEGPIRKPLKQGCPVSAFNRLCAHPSRIPASCSCNDNPTGGGGHRQAVRVDDSGDAGAGDRGGCVCSGADKRAAVVWRPARVIDAPEEVLMPWRDPRRTARAVVHIPRSATDRMDATPGLRLPRHPHLASGLPFRLPLAI